MAEALRGVDGVCRQEAVASLGQDVANAREYVGCNDLGMAVLPARYGRSRRARLGVGELVIVHGEGRYECLRRGVVRPGPRRVADLEAGGFERPCPHGGEPSTAGPVEEDVPAEPRQRVHGH
ncbi:hypothetical protein [Streptomyces sp. TLI_185]|uniref:hypothetical protein n=1 Tax=Streptomyces sp. TLI_185 TaxID=2485151 RepID=UPI000F4D8123|nr:hypothetical protein [Streptomyces sp. TLI_185]